MINSVNSDFLILLAAEQSYFDRYVAAGGIMMWVLVPLAVIALGMVLQIAIALRGGRFFAKGDPEALLAQAQKGMTGPVEQYTRDNPGLVLARLIRGLNNPGLAHAPDELIRMEVARLFRKVHPLSVISNVAPFIGLLGTVIGLMQTFQTFTAQTDPDIADLSQGLYTAMTTTLWGLSIAVPTYLFFHFFRARLIRYEEDVLPTIFLPIAAALLHGGDPDISIAAQEAAAKPSAVMPLEETPLAVPRADGEMRLARDEQETLQVPSRPASGELNAEGVTPDEPTVEVPKPKLD